MMTTDMIYFDAAKCGSLFGNVQNSEIESKVLAASSSLDLNKADDGSATDGKPFHDKLKGANFVKAQGWASIEDFDRFRHMSENSNPIIEFIGRCTLQALEQSPDYQKAQLELDNLRGTLKKEVDRNKRASLEARVKTAETRFRNLVAEQTQLQGLPDWMVAGFQTFIDAFLRGRVTFRVYPFERIPELQIVGNLRRDCFVNSSVEHFIATYGSRPLAKMTMLGMVTSVPELSGHPFNAMAQFQRLSEQKQDVKLEMGFRQFYNALEMLESLIGFSRYPNAIVHPLAIYRQL